LPFDVNGLPLAYGPMTSKTLKEAGSGNERVGANSNDVDVVSVYSATSKDHILSVRR